jgi:hypothetical protein
VFEGGIDAHHLGIRLAVDQAREPVDAVTADAGTAVDGFAVLVLVEQDAEGEMREMQSQSC